MTMIQLTLTEALLAAEQGNPRAFDGETFDSKLDGKRLSRQYDRVLEFMSDGKPHTLEQIAAACDCSEAAASARLRDFRKPAPHGFNAVVERERDPVVKGLFWYRLEGVKV